jgi:hypothetical protein
MTEKNRIVYRVYYSDGKRWEPHGGRLHPYEFNDFYEAKSTKLGLLHRHLDAMIVKVEYNLLSIEGNQELLLLANLNMVNDDGTDYIGHRWREG